MEILNIEKDICAEKLKRQREQSVHEQEERNLKKRRLLEEAEIQKEILVQEQKRAQAMAETIEFQRKEAEAKYLLAQYMLDQAKKTA